MAEPAPTTVMSEALHGLRISPAAHLADVLRAESTPGVVELREVPFLTMIGLRVVPGSITAKRIESVLGQLPAGCGHVAGAETGAVLWLGPHEFLVVAPVEASAELGGDLERELLGALADGEGQVVDLSANRTTFELTGSRVRDVLRKGCSLDLHPRVFAVDTAVPTEVGGVAAILWRTDHDTYRVLPRSSFSDFIGRWLLDAMREFAAVTVA